jgi:serine/threonine protein kinase
MATVETLRVGDRIADKYIIERVLGKGGMGMVVAARHVDLDQMVAIKFILPDALRQQGVVERLLREARASAKLRSEHVAKVVDVGRTPDGAPYLVMELLEGRDLAQILDERTVIPSSEAALYIGQACEAIAEAHGAGIIHRDIKPANLFVVTRRDGSPCVKVLDFGIAKEDSLANAAMTSTGSVLGTPMYMSPEQVRSSKTATPATDIWALGITLYELTTGHIPYDVTTVTELIAKILTEPPIAARVRNPSLSAEMDAVIMRCLQVDPALRYRSATELQTALAPFAFPRSPSATGAATFGGGPVNSGAFLANPVSGLTPPAPQQSFAGAMPVGAPVVASSRILPQTTETSTSVAIHPAKGSSKAPVIALAAVAVLGILGGGAAFMLTRTPPAPIAASSAPEPTAPPAATSAAIPADVAPEPAPPATSAEAAPPEAPSASSAPSTDPVPATSGSARAEPPRNPAKKTPTAPKTPDKPPAAATTKPGWGGLL